MTFIPSPPMSHPHALAVIALAGRVLDLARLPGADQRAAAIDLVGDLYALADSIDVTAGHLVGAVGASLDGTAPADHLRAALDAYNQAAALALPEAA
uniref:Uncharacterized protein n=1 Tax=Caulobacter phage BL57 TaxID=3348355 RepID=A0AB74UGF9_9VIRU